VRRIRSFDWSENFVQGVEEHPTEALASLARAMYTPEIVIHVYVESERLAASSSGAGDVAMVQVSTIRG
jgi:hypothetical protein